MFDASLVVGIVLIAMVVFSIYVMGVVAKHQYKQRKYKDVVIYASSGVFAMYIGVMIAVTMFISL